MKKHGCETNGPCFYPAKFQTAAKRITWKRMEEASNSSEMCIESCIGSMKRTTVQSSFRTPNEFFLYLFLLSYSNPVHPHPAHTHIQFTGRFFSAADVLFRLAWRSASFHFGSKFYTLFVLKGPVEMPVRFSM